MTLSELAEYWWLLPLLLMLLCCFRCRGLCGVSRDGPGRRRDEPNAG